MCIPITVTAIKIKLTLYVLSAAYGHSLGCFFGYITVSLLRSGSQHLSFFVGSFLIVILNEVKNLFGFFLQLFKILHLRSG